MSKTKDLIRYAIALLFLHQSFARGGRGYAFSLLIAGLLPTSAFCRADVLELDASHFEVVTTSSDQGGQSYLTTRVTFLDAQTDGITGIRCKLYIQTNILATFLVTKSWSSAFESMQVTLEPDQGNPNAVWVDFIATSGTPLDGDLMAWMEVTYSGSEGTSLFKARAEIPGIVQVDIIEGGCKSIAKSNLVVEGDLPSRTADQVQIFPNPTVERIQVDWGQEHQRTHRLRLIDGAGQVVMERQVAGTSAELEVGHLATGTYYLIGLSGETVLWQKPILKR